MLRSLSLVRPFESRLQTWIHIWRATCCRYEFKSLLNRTRRSSRRGGASRRACRSVAERAADGKVRARTRAGAAAPCFLTLWLAQVSLPARPRPHSVLLCVLTPWLSSMAQPDLRLHPVCGRRLSEAAFEAAFDGCHLAALGRSLAARRSSRRPPWCHRGGRLHRRRATFEVRTAVDRRACCPGLPGRSTRTHYRAGGPLEPPWGSIGRV